MRFRPTLVLALSLFLSLPVAAQSPPTDSSRRAADSLSLDSLRARLERAEQAIAILRGQLGDEAEAAVHTAIRFGMNSVFGLGGLFDVATGAGLAAVGGTGAGVGLRVMRAALIDTV